MLLVIRAALRVFAGLFTPTLGPVLWLLYCAERRQADGGGEPWDTLSVGLLLAGSVLGWGLYALALTMLRRRSSRARAGGDPAGRWWCEVRWVWELLCLGVTLLLVSALCGIPLDVLVVGMAPVLGVVNTGWCGGDADPNMGGGGVDAGRPWWQQEEEERAVLGTLAVASLPVFMYGGWTVGHTEASLHGMSGLEEKGAAVPLGSWQSVAWALSLVLLTAQYVSGDHEDGRGAPHPILLLLESGSLSSSSFYFYSYAGVAARVLLLVWVWAIGTGALNASLLGIVLCSVSWPARAAVSAAVQGGGAPARPGSSAVVGSILSVVVSVFLAYAAQKEVAEDAPAWLAAIVFVVVVVPAILALPE